MLGLKSLQGEPPTCPGGTGHRLLWRTTPANVTELVVGPLPQPSYMRDVTVERHGQFISVAQSCPTLCDLMNRSMPGLPVQHQLPEYTQTHMQVRKQQLELDMEQQTGSK